MFGKKRLIILVGFLFLLLPSQAWSVQVERGTFHDAARKRDVLFKAFWPKAAIGPLPVVIFSHGLGGTREVAAYLGNGLAKAGYLSIHIQHAGSDRGEIGQVRSRREAIHNLRKSLRNPKNFLNRMQDLPFVVSELERRNHAGPWAGRLDMERVGMAGHSYGARSTMYAAGEKGGGVGASFKVRRIRAGVVLSPGLPRRQVDLAQTYSEIDIPLFHITGTKDGSPIQKNLAPIQRTKPYQLIPAGDQYLLVLKDADHATFSGSRVRTGREKPKDPIHLTAIVRGVVAFFDAFLRGDSAKKRWLQTQFKKGLSAEDRFEFR